MGQSLVLTKVMEMNSTRRSRVYKRMKQIPSGYFMSDHVVFSTLPWCSTRPLPHASTLFPNFLASRTINKARTSLFSRTASHQSVCYSNRKWTKATRKLGSSL